MMAANSKSTLGNIFSKIRPTSPVGSCIVSSVISEDALKIKDIPGASVYRKKDIASMEIAIFAVPVKRLRKSFIKKYSSQ